MTYKCLIIDDEPLARDILERYIAQVDFLELSGKCKSALEAINILKTSRIDIIFLDIQMPDLNGIDFLKSIKVRPKIIFTTAYEQYAVESYNHDALDYLMKPVSFQRFLKAIDKLSNSADIDTKTIAQGQVNEKDRYIFINTGGRLIRLFLDEILYIKSLGDYIEIKSRAKNYIIRENMKSLETLLEPENFIRIHKSFIVPVSKINVIEGNLVRIGSDDLPIGKLYKAALLNSINNRRIG